jgi:hypothetical protein
MRTTAGSGLIGLGVVMGVVGAVLEFAVTASGPPGFDVNTVGLILLVAGLVVCLLGLGVVVMSGWRRSTVREEVQLTPQGRQRLEQREDVG